MAALREDKSLPIVFVQVIDPVGGRFVPNLARPGGYLTGFTSFEFTIGSKWLEALKHVAPKVTRVASLDDQSAQGAARCRDDLIDRRVVLSGVDFFLPTGHDAFRP